MAPRVLVDATAIPPDRGGVGRYVDEFAAALSTLCAGSGAGSRAGTGPGHAGPGHAGPGHAGPGKGACSGGTGVSSGAGRALASGAEVGIVCQRRDVKVFAREAPALTIIPAPEAVVRRPVRLVWEQLGLPALARRFRADVIHSPHYTMPLAGPLVGCPAVVTLHDATFFTDPERHLAVKRRFFRVATRASLTLAARCIVPSQATRAELVRLLGADERGIDVIYHGVDHETFRLPDAEEVARVSARLGLHGRPYIAFLGTLEPRKNVPNLIRGWARAVADRAEAPALVLAGGAGWEEAVMAAAAEVPPHLELLQPGYLPYQDLRGYLGGAVLVAYPSVGEGFGLPVLEAMACGAPVLTTRRLSLPEVGGDAVAYTESDPDSIAAALDKLLGDPDGRAALGAAGRARSLQFTWERSALSHLTTYEQAVNVP